MSIQKNNMKCVCVVGCGHHLRVLHLHLHPHLLPQDPPRHAGTSYTQHHRQNLTQHNRYEYRYRLSYTTSPSKHHTTQQARELILRSYSNFRLTKLTRWGMIPWRRNTLWGSIPRRVMFFADFLLTHWSIILGGDWLARVSYPGEIDPPG